MITEQVWQARKEEVAKMKEERDALSKQISELVEARKKLSQKIHYRELAMRAHENLKEHREQNPVDKSNTYAYQMFGKRLKDLTPEEYRAYYNERQRVNRANRKKGIYKRKH